MENNRKGSVRSQVNQVRGIKRKPGENALELRKTQLGMLELNSHVEEGTVWLRGGGVAGRLKQPRPSN